MYWRCVAPMFAWDSQHWREDKCGVLCSWRKTVKQVNWLINPQICSLLSFVRLGTEEEYCMSVYQASNITESCLWFLQDLRQKKSVLRVLIKLLVLQNPVSSFCTTWQNTYSVYKSIITTVCPEFYKTIRIRFTCHL